jgi:hypothetical protein
VNVAVDEVAIGTKYQIVNGKGHDRTGQNDHDVRQIFHATPSVNLSVDCL